MTFQEGFDAAIEQVRQTANQRYADSKDQTALDTACRYEVMQCLALVKRARATALVPVVMQDLCVIYGPTTIWAFDIDDLSVNAGTPFTVRLVRSTGGVLVAAMVSPGRVHVQRGHGPLMFDEQWLWADPQGIAVPSGETVVLQASRAAQGWVKHS